MDTGTNQVMLAGGTAKIPAIARSIGEQTGYPVEVVNPFASFTFDPKTYNPDYLSDVAPMASVAAGLALRRTNEQ